MKPLRILKRLFEYAMRISGLGKRFCSYHLRNAIRLQASERELEASGKITLFSSIEPALPEEDILLNLRWLPGKLPYPPIQMREVPYYRFRANRAWIVRNATLFGRDANASLDGRIIMESVYYCEAYLMMFLSFNLYHSPRWVLTTLDPLRQRLPAKPVKRVQHALALTGRWHNYYHWITEQLPKLRAAERYREQAGELPLLILPSETSRYMLDSLDRMGYENAEKMSWNSKAVRVDELVVSSYPEVTRESLKWLRSKMMKPGSSPSDSENKLRLYISRRDAGKRRVLNEEELEPVLRNHGFEIIIPSEHPLEEQIRLFRQAEMVVGPHGAGLTNLIWGEGLKVIELFGGEIRFHYTHISRLLGFEYRALACRPVGETEDMIADPARLEEAVCSVIEAKAVAG